MLKTKLLVNSTISDAHKGAQFMSTDLKDFSWYPHGRGQIHESAIQTLSTRYTTRIQAQQKSNNKWIYLHKIKKGMYGLKHAAILAYENLKNHLARHGYTPVVGAA